MLDPSRSAPQLLRLLTLLTLIPTAFGMGCASLPHAEPTSYEFFGRAAPEGDPWFEKIQDWQAREQRDRAGPAATAAGPASRVPLHLGPLEIKFDSFLQDQKREAARAFAAWSQEQARKHYRPEEEQSVADDRWPTLQELFDTNGDDCDGLDLLAYNLLRELGFTEDEVYRAIVRRQRDGANHMVTLWFEDRVDPWVIDATGAMTTGMRRWSELPPGWVPTKVFNETEQYSVLTPARPPYALAAP